MVRALQILLLVTSFFLGAQNTPQPDVTSIKNPKEVVTPSKKGKEDLNAFDQKDLTSQEFELQLRGLEHDVNRLKEKVFRSKARLSTLNETLVSGRAVQGAKLILNHLNEFSNFRVKSIIYHLDGTPLFAQADVEGALSKQQKINLYDKIIIPGNHMISALIKIEVKGFGLFSYAKGYRFQIKTSHSFYIEEGKITTINVTLYEKGGFFSDLTKKPDVVFKAGIKKDISRAREVTSQKSGKTGKK